MILFNCKKYDKHGISTNLMPSEQHIVSAKNSSIVFLCFH
nr:MAG TPA: hypothetical protein [Bacteriophage sp.]